MKSFLIALFLLSATTSELKADILANLVEQVIPSVVVIYNEPNITEPTVPIIEMFKGTVHTGTRLGTGFFIKDNVIMTNYHVISGDNRIIYVTLSNNQHKRYVGEIVGYDKWADVALIKINATMPSVVFNTNKVRKGNDVFTVGHPKALKFSVSKGIIAHEFRRHDTFPYITMIQSDAAINPGNSGGPMFNTLGQVIGMNTLIITEGGGFEGISLAIDVRTLIRSVEKILDQGIVKRTSLDVLLKSVYVDGKFSGATVVTSYDPLSSLQDGDVIIKIDGRKIRHLLEIIDYSQTKNVGDTIVCTIERNKQIIDIEFKLKGAN